MIIKLILFVIYYIQASKNRTTSSTILSITLVNIYKLFNLISDKIPINIFIIYFLITSAIMLIFKQIATIPAENDSV
jgi:hypothetical protein